MPYWSRSVRVTVVLLPEVTVLLATSSVLPLSDIGPGTTSKRSDCPVMFVAGSVATMLQVPAFWMVIADVPTPSVSSTEGIIPG